MEIESRLRDAGSADAESLHEIYARHVLEGLGTFEETPPPAGELDARRAAVQSLGLPFLVLEHEGRVAGFAYASPFRMRSAYRFVVEDSVYLAPELQGRGGGKRLLTELLERCRPLGIRQVLAVIGDSGNAASIRLHRSLGFKAQGVLAAVGYKHGRWLDVVLMQKELDGGADAPPSGAGLRL